jgi:Undecaprenyl-phosphate galactose phosphotransferase WbaP
MEKIIDKSLIAVKYVEPNTQPFQNRWAVLETNARLWMAFTLWLSDSFGFLLAILLASQVHALLRLLPQPNIWKILLLLGITMCVAFSRKGLYPAVGLNYVEELREIVSSTTFAVLILIGVTFLFRTSTLYSRLLLVMVWAFCIVLIPLGRYLLRRFLIRQQLWGEPVAIIGDWLHDISLAEYFKKNLQLGLRPVAVLRDDHFEQGRSNYSPLMSLQQIKEYARENSLNTVLVVIKDLNELDALVNRYRFVFQRVILVKGRNGSFILNSLKSMDFSDVLGFQVMNNLLSAWSQTTKRVLDVFFSALGLLLLSPFFALTALLIKIDTGSKVFYKQKRLGRDGAVFEMYKFRTMYHNADKILTKKLSRDPELKAEWDRYQKLKKDPRVTRVGGLLRKFSLDELPQLMNVLRGEMSLVGPRPMIVNQRELYGEAYKEYVRVTPGMTGLWQVSGRSETTFARRSELDIEYIQRWSIFLDIYILIKTIKIVFWQRGAY